MQNIKGLSLNKNNVYENTLMMTNPSAYALYMLGKGTIESFKQATNNNNIQDMQNELEKRKIQLEFELIEAKRDQERAIAKRIENAEEVEIEEYYDISGKGNVGLQANEKGIKLESSAEGNKVTKRIYRFKAKSTKLEDIES